MRNCGGMTKCVDYFVISVCVLFQIQVTHASVPRTYKIIKVSLHGSDRQLIPHKNEGGNTINCTVESYFKTMYGRKLNCPKLNCLQVAPAARNIFLPIEVCIHFV